MDKKRNIVILVFIVPIIVSYIFELIIEPGNSGRFSNFLEHILFAVILVSVSFLITRTGLKNLYLKSLFVLFCLMLFFETIYYYYFKSTFNPSAMFIILETNGEESKEFLASYFDGVSMFIAVFYVLLIAAGLYLLSTYKKNRKRIKPILALALIMVSGMTLKVSKLIDYNLAYAVTKGSSVYVDEMMKFENQDETDRFTNLKHNTHSEDTELYVVLIGESVSRLHVQLYNQYYRETTPLLAEIKEELLVMENVISPHTYTIAALTKGLTLANAENPTGKFDGSIIQLFNQAGFKTYWISNQRPVGISDTQVTRIASDASETIFLNAKHTSEKTPYDDVVLGELEKVFEDKAKKKIVFVHMIGVHKEYDKRYPPSFEYFKTVPQSKFKDEKSHHIINAYDNAIRYTDSVVRNVIELVRNEDALSYVLYLSDHGQEVFDDIEFHGQTNDQMVTKNMYEIPFFLWTSKNYRARNTFMPDVREKYMTDDLIHTIADISKITAEEIDSTRSLFSPAFIARKRVIKETIDYDTYFSSGNHLMNE